MNYFDFPFSVRATGYTKAKYEVLNREGQRFFYIFFDDFRLNKRDSFGTTLNDICIFMILKIMVFNLTCWLDVK